MKRFAIATLLSAAILMQGTAPAIADPKPVGIERVDYSPRDSSMSGVKPSTYRGKFYTKAAERARKCIIQRESNGHYFSVSSGGHAGAYQLAPAFQHGAPYMVVKALSIKGPAARALVAKMQHVPIKRWSRHLQDTAFFAIMNWDHQFSGAKHWFKSGSRCNALVLL